MINIYCIKDTDNARAVIDLFSDKLVNYVDIISAMPGYYVSEFIVRQYPGIDHEIADEDRGIVDTDMFYTETYNNLICTGDRSVEWLIKTQSLIDIHISNIILIIYNDVDIKYDILRQLNDGATIDEIVVYQQLLNNDKYDISYIVSICNKFAKCFHSDRTVNVYMYDDISLTTQSLLSTTSGDL